MVSSATPTTVTPPSSRTPARAVAPAFATAVDNPFGLADVGYYAASPSFADPRRRRRPRRLHRRGRRQYPQFFQNSGSAVAPAFAGADQQSLRTGRRSGTTARTSSSPTSTATATSTLSSASFNGYAKILREQRLKRRAPRSPHRVNNPFGLASRRHLAEQAELRGRGWRRRPRRFHRLENPGNTRFFENTGSGVAPAFAASVDNPFGLADVGEFEARRPSRTWTVTATSTPSSATCGGNTELFENTTPVPVELMAFADRVR